jgi:hypothetical protein
MIKEYTIKEAEDKNWNEEWDAALPFLPYLPPCAEPTL